MLTSVHKCVHTENLATKTLVPNRRYQCDKGGYKLLKMRYH